MCAWETTDVYQVGVYWPEEGSYGIPTTCYFEQIPGLVRELLRQHYGCGGALPSEIHIRRVRIDRVTLEEVGIECPS
jgi:hypothetical protein